MSVDVPLAPVTANVTVASEPEPVIPARPGIFCTTLNGLAEAAGQPVLIDDETAAMTHRQVAGDFASWFSAQPMFEQILRDQPDLLD